MNSNLRIPLRLAPSGLAQTYPSPKGEGFADPITVTLNCSIRSFD